jgi:hypothetical protein
VALCPRAGDRIAARSGAADPESEPATTTSAVVPPSAGATGIAAVEDALAPAESTVVDAFTIEGDA